jgi:DNA-binding NarL/FixJ family response regulator
MEGATTNIAVVHSNRLFREALVCAVSMQEGLSVIADVGAIDQIRAGSMSPHGVLFLVEASVPLRNCLEQASRIQTIAPESKTIMLGIPNEDEAAFACIEQGGASGYVFHDASFDDLMRTITAVLNGEILCSPRVANLALSRVSTLSRLANTPFKNQAKLLTHREQNIIGFIERGLSNKEIAVQLGIEVSTVKNHVHNILDKLHTPNRYAAVKYVKEQGLATTQF